MALRGPTPVRSAPRASMIPLPESATKQSRLDELMVKNRSLDHTIEKLKTSLATEETRSKDTIQKIQQKWQTERAEWREGCDALQAAHRIAHLQTAVELQMEKTTLMKERDESRKERLALLQRDFRLFLFQMEESTNEHRINQLQEELDDVRKTREREIAVLVANHEEVANDLQIRCEKLEGQLGPKTEELESLVEEKTQLEKTLSGLRADHTALLSSSSSSKTDLERANLRLEGVKANHAELATKYEDLQRTNADLLKQLEKWRALESREDGERENLRQRKIDLEVRVEELESRLKEAERTAQQREDKAKARVEKYRASLEEHKKALEEANEATEDLEAEGERAKKELADAQKRLTRAEKEVEELQTQLHDERTKAQSLKHKAKPVSSKPSPVPALPSEDEVQDIIVGPPKPKPRPKARPASKLRETENDDGLELVEVPPPKGTRVSRRVDDEVEIMESVPKKGRKGKGKVTEDDVQDDAEPAQAKGGRKGKKKEVPAQEQDSDVQMVEKPAPHRIRSKRKADEMSGEEQEEGGKKLKRKAVAVEEVGEVNQAIAVGKPKTTAKPPRRTRAPSKGPSGAQSVEDEPEKESESTPKKKKRKINLFPTAQATTFNWSGLSQGTGGLDIPTDLSPVKESDAVPPRSTSRIGSSFGWPQTGRR